MSLINECQEYHLADVGWVEGSFRADVLGTSDEKEKPPWFGYDKIGLMK